MQDADWKDAGTQFAGWVPNVLGHLSFSLIGRGTKPDAHCTCAEVDGRQEVVAFQVRQADDAALHRLITRWTTPRSVHDWLLFARSREASYPSSKNLPCNDAQMDVYHDSRGMLRGTIHVLGGRSWKRSGFFGQFKFRWHRWRFRSAVTKQIRILGRQDGAASSPIAGVEPIIDLYKKKGLEFGNIEICLFRTGEIRIWYDSDSSIKNEAARTAAPKIAYFFIKDITHLHTHHHHSQDGMIPFCQINPNDNNGEKVWQRRTIWALSRSIEEYVRKGTRADLRSAMGMIPYAENFHSLYGGLHRTSGHLHKFTPINDHEFDHYSFEGLRKMISTIFDARGVTLTARTAVVAVTIPIMLSSIIAVNAVGFVPNDPPQWPTWLQNMAHDYPHWVVPCILVLMFFVYRIAYREAGQDEWLFTPAKTYTRAVKAAVVSLGRLLPFPPLVGYLLVLVAQFAILFLAIKIAFRLL